MDAGSIPTRAFVEADTVRLIASVYANEPLAQLTDSETEEALLLSLSNLSRSGSVGNRTPLPRGIEQHELLTPDAGFGWSYVNAAFCHPRTTGSRFNGPDRGAWYASYGREAAETSKAELVWHLSRDLAHTGQFRNSVVYRELLADFDTVFHSLDGYGDHTCLDPDTSVGYPAGQAIANDLRTKHSSNGVTYPSVRLHGGTCFADFIPDLISNVRHGRLWQFTWDGQPEPQIEEP